MFACSDEAWSGVNDVEGLVAALVGNISACCPLDWDVVSANLQKRIEADPLLKELFPKRYKSMPKTFRDINLVCRHAITIFYRAFKAADYVTLPAEEA